MLEGFTPWDAGRAQRYIDAGYWQNRTIAEMVFAHAGTHPGKVALIDGETEITYAALKTITERLAYRLIEEGIRPEDRVVMQLANSAGFVFSYLALTRIGAIPVMALRAHRQTEIQHFAAASGAAAYMIPDKLNDFDFRIMAEAIRGMSPALKTVLVLGDPLEGQMSLSRMINEDVPPGRVSAALDGLRPDPCGVATMLLSGGTTSLPKLIPRTHNDYLLNARLCADAAGFDAGTRFMAVLPLGHNYNLASPGILGAFYYGGCAVLCPSADAATVFPLVERHGVTTIAAAVPLIANWLNSPVPAKCNLKSLKSIQNGGARLAPELRRRIRSEFGCLPQEIYGTAEGLINMTRLDDPGDLLLESSGAPVCDADEIRVLDENGNELPDGEAGELVTRGPYTIQGYYKGGDKNKEAFTADGFYRMGDIVRKRGRYIFAEGRVKDLINRGGEKISCEEVENLILKNPKVHQVALVAMPDPVFGEKACAFVITKPGETLRFAELIDFLKTQKIASFKLPERLEVVDRFPTSLVGKILKRELREQIAGKIKQED